MTVPHVAPGQKWSYPKAADANEIADAANWVAAHREGNAFDAPPCLRQTDHIHLTNGSGTTAVAGEVLGIQAPIVSPVDDADHAAARARHAGELPARGIADPARNHIGKFAVLDEAAATSAFARGVVSGLVYAQITVVEQWHEFADIDVHGVGAVGRTLVSTSCGSACAQILWKASGTGMRWALLRLANAGQFHLVGVPIGDGITARALTVPGTGVVQVYRRVGSALAAVVDQSSNLVYQTVYSLSDDPILPQTGTPSYGLSEDYYLLHCDRWHTWWIEPHSYPKLATIYLGSPVLQNPAAGIASSGYLSHMTITGNPSNLDLQIVQEPIYVGAGNEFCRVLVTGDYHLAFHWGGGVSEKLAGTLPVFYRIEIVWRFISPAGVSSTVFYAPSSAMRVIVGTSASYAQDKTGHSMSTCVRLTAGTKIEGEISLLVGAPGDSVKFNNVSSQNDEFCARLTALKVA